jgi:hypothetical protein
VLDAIGARLQQHGWPSWDRFGKGLIAQSERMMDVASIDAMSDVLHALAAEFYVVYDGWKCAIVNDKKN